MEFVAPKKVYQVPRRSAEQAIQAGGYTLGEPLGLAKTKTGGLATWFAGHPYPRKGFIYYGITEPNNKAKRVTLSLFLPFASLRHGVKAFLNSYLFNYNRLIDSFYHDCDQIPYLHYQYYSEFGKSLWDFIYFFLKKLGIKDQIAYRTGMQLATMVEYDDAYKVRLQDILNEADKNNLLKNPGGELSRLLEIYLKREPFLDKNNPELSVSGRFVGFIKLIKIALFFPPIKNAFRFALENVNFEWFKLDEIDYYWALNRGDYNPGGKTFEERKKEGVEMMLDFAQKSNPGKTVRKAEQEDGSVQILIEDYAV